MLKTPASLKKAKILAATLALGVASLVGFQNCGGFGTAFPSDALNSESSTPFIDDSADKQFAAAKGVLDAKCNSCHNGSAASNFTFASSNEFVSSGLVVAGVPSASKLILRLQNYPVKDGSQNMPQGGGPLTSAEYSLLTNWISNLPSTSVNQFTCQSTEEPATLDAKRLSRLQIYNSIRDLMSRAIGATDAGSFMTSADIFARLPVDSAAPYSTSDSNFSSLHAQAMFDIADLVAKAAVSSANYSRFVTTYVNYDKGSCVLSDVNVLSAACRDVLIKNFLLRAWGRPAETTAVNLNNEIASFQNDFATAGSSSAGVEAMVYRAMLSPEFMFHLQSDVAASNNAYRLSSYLIARRLAFLFTQTLPDESLLALARTQDLMDETAFASALELVAAKMDLSVDVFTREWLKTGSLPNYKEQTHPKFTLITTGLTADDALRTAMTDELVELTKYISKNNRPVKELFTTNISFARNPSLMKIYGQTTAAPANVTEANAVRFPAGERSGLLTRAGYLFSGGHSENPIKRGIHIRQQMFCLTLASPPAGASDQLNPPVPDVNLTTRERYAAKTAVPACIGCHAQINPVGFAFSKYNSFGALQIQEPIYDGGNPAQLIRYLPTDSTANLAPAVGLNANVKDGVEFSELVADSSLFKGCLTQNMYTFAQGLSALPTSTNSCAMNRMYKSLEGAATLQDFIKSAAQDPRFRYRKIQK